MEIIIWIVAIIVYVIANAGGRTGRMSSRRYFGRYGLFGLTDYQEDFSIEYNPLEDVRQTYNERLKIYYQNNQPKSYLVNNNCEARLVTEKNGDLWFHVKEKTNGKSQGKYFEVKGDSTHSGTMWAIIDMEFSSLTRYSDIKSLYYKLNKGFETVGGLKYFHESLRKRLPDPQINKNAQNEYCRMEIQDLTNGDKVIICSEIWASLKYNKPRKFAICADKYILYGILSEFSKNKNKMQSYTDLLYQYTNRKDSDVKELNVDIEQVQNTDSAKKLLEEIEQRENKSKKNSENEDIEQVSINVNDAPADMNKSNSIKRFDERNLDI